MRGKIERICVNCKEKFFSVHSQIKVGKGKYCSKKCAYGEVKLLKGKKFSSMIIESPKHGKLISIFDTEEFDRLKSLGGKWSISIRRDKPYVEKRFKGNNLIQLHRYLMDAKKGDYVDHINRNTLDNRKINLRICTNSANIRNGRIRPNNKSGYTGISFVNKQSLHPWIARIRVKYKYIHLGSYKTFDEAVEARKKGEKKYWSI